MRTMPIKVFNNKRELDEYLAKLQAKEHYKFKKHYGTPNNTVYRVTKRKDGKYVIYEVYGAVRKDGYVILNIVGTTITKHRFIMEAFNGRRPKGQEIDHVNSNKQDNNLSNLMYVTHAQNMQKFWREHNAKTF